MKSVRFLLAAVVLAWPLTRSAVADSAASWIKWDRASDRVVSAPHDTGAAYPRARQLSNREILLTYHHGDGPGNCGSCVTVRKSRDGGATWYRTQVVDSTNERGFWGFSNPDLVELGHGRVMLVSAARGRADADDGNGFLAECRRSGLCVRFSSDFGNTWGPPRIVAGGRGRVWEPSIARLPDGELQIFYAIESPGMMTRGYVQSIEAIRSLDGGQSWSAPVLVSQRSDCLNGVPGTLALHNGHVLCAQEVVGMATSPWIADTFEGRTRDVHLAQDRYEFGGAPFLARALDGHTLLAFHSQCRQTEALKHIAGAWLLSDIFVQRGDAEGNHFGPAACPWPTEDALSGAFFPSVMVMNDGTLVVLASFITVRPDHTTSTVVRWIKGRLRE